MKERNTQQKKKKKNTIYAFYNDKIVFTYSFLDAMINFTHFIGESQKIHIADLYLAYKFMI